MSKIEKFLNFIHQNTENRYPFLILKAISFKKQTNVLSMYFLYPSNIDFTTEDINTMTNVIKEYVSLDLTYDIEFSKSYFEKDLILKRMKEFLDKNNHLFFSQIDFGDVKITIDDNKATIIFKLDNKMAEFFESAKIPTELKKYLSANFCGEFEVTYERIEEIDVQDSFLKEKFEQVKYKSELDIILNASKDKYIVENVEVIVGKDIPLSPRYIKSIDRVYEDCVIGGTINFITERNYTKIRKKKDSDEEETILKPFFNFQIKDDTGSIHAVIFPSKANYHKMNLLQNGDTVIVEGKIQKYNGGFEITAKNISKCSIPSKTMYDAYVGDTTSNTYRYVTPQPFTTRRQANLFDNNYMSKEVSNSSFVVYDFETTGIDAKNDEIVEIGALKIENGKFKEVFTTLVKPKKLIPIEATRVHKITNDMVANALSIEQVLRDFYLFCKGAQMVGYNSLAFDKLFLDREAKNIGINFDNENIDVYLLAKQKLNNLSNYKLGTVSKHLDVSLINAHRALNDVIATAEVFLKLY